MRRKKRSTAIESRLTICFEGIRRIIQRDSKQQAYKQISQAVQAEVEPGIVEQTGPLDEPTSEDTVPALIQQQPVTNHVAAIVGLISHHVDNAISLGAVDAFG